jgi:hypothetical protein
VFGPSRSWDLERALRVARTWAARLSQRPDGSWRAEFVLADDPKVYDALETILWLLVRVRGTEVTHRGLPMAPAVALVATRHARRRLRPVYTVPPPRDVASLVAQDITEGQGVGTLLMEWWGAHRDKD